MRLLLAGIAFAALAVPAGAADLTFPVKAPVAANSAWFFYAGLESGGTVTNHSFDFTGTGTGSVQIGGIVGGGLLGFEYKSPYFMFRGELDADYDFGRGGTVCAGLGLACHVNNGVRVTERVDLGFPQAWLGNSTPFVSAGLTQFAVGSTVDAVGSTTQWNNAVLLGAGIDIPMGFFSWGARWDHIFSGQATGLGTLPGITAVANTQQGEVFRVNMKWRLN